MSQDYQKFLNIETEIVIVGPEKAESFHEYWVEEKLPFIGLPDPGHVVLNLYGQEVRVLKLGRMPAQMLIDKAGMLKYVHYGKSMSDIPSNDEIIGQIK